MFQYMHSIVFYLSSILKELNNELFISIVPNMSEQKIRGNRMCGIGIQAGTHFFSLTSVPISFNTLLYEWTHFCMCRHTSVCMETLT